MAGILAYTGRNADFETLRRALNKEKCEEKNHLFADVSDFLWIILGVSSDNLGTVLISTRLLLGILVPDSLEK